MVTIRNRISSAIMAFRSPRPTLPIQKNFPLRWHTVRNGQSEWINIDYDSYVKEGYSSNELVYTPLKYKADAFASLPIVALTGDKFHPEPADENHPLTRFAKRPNKFQSMLEFIQLVDVYLNLSGNAFIYYIGITGSEELQAFALRPDRILIIPNDDKKTVFYAYIQEGGTRESALIIKPENMLHIKFPNPQDPLEGQGWGLSPLGASAQIIDVDNIITKFLFQFFSSNGLMPGGVIQLPYEADDDDIMKLRDQFTEEYGGSNQWGKPLVIDQEGKFVAASMNFDDLNFSELDKRNATRGTAPFGVPAMLLGFDSSSETFSNRAEAEQTFWSHTMFGESQLIELELQFKINFSDGTWLEFDPSNTPAFKADRESKVSMFKDLTSFLVPPNEAARFVGLKIPHIEGGDISYHLTSLIPAGQSQLPAPETDTTPATESDMEDEQAADTEDIDNMDKRASVALQRPVKDAQDDTEVWTQEYKALLGKQLDEIAESHEDRFARMTAGQFNRERKAILAILREEKSASLRLKATVNWSAVNQGINAYMQLKSPQEWREAARPHVLSVAIDAQEHWINVLNVSDEIATFSLRAIESEAWFDQYLLSFSQEVTATTSNDIHNIIAASMQSGDGLDVTANRIGKMFDQYITGGLSPDDFDFMEARMPVHRLEMIARTETHGASQAGSNALYQNAGIQKKEWLATLDQRTRDSHIQAESKYAGNGAIFVNDPFIVNGVELMYPGDKGGFSFSNGAAEIINCFIPDTKVSGSFVAGSKVWYSGSVWELETSRGHRLTVTPYHPILTNRGWIPANELIKGDYLLTSRDNIHSGMQLDINHQDSPSRIEDVFNTIRSNGRMITPMATALDFDGDGRRCEGEINIVYVDGVLPLDIDRHSSIKNSFDFEFIPSSDFAGILVNADGTPNLDLIGIGIATPSLPSVGHLPLKTGGVSLNSLPFDPLRLGLASQWDTVSGKESRDNPPAVSKFFAELIDASSGFVSPDNLIRVREYDFSGHVYDLQAIDGWILSENIVSGNCRCISLPVVD